MANTTVRPVAVEPVNEIFRTFGLKHSSLPIAGPSVPMPVQLAYGLFIAATHVLWFALVAWFFSAPVLQPRVQAARPWIDRSLGCVLLALGLLLIGTSAPQALLNS